MNNYFLLTIGLILTGVYFWKLFTSKNKDRLYYEETNVEEAKAEDNFYPYYVAPPKKGMKVKILVITSLDKEVQFKSLQSASKYTFVSTEKIKECIGSNIPYSGFIFKQLLY
jgi:hypothetical protein